MVALPSEPRPLVDGPAPDPEAAVADAYLALRDRLRAVLVRCTRDGEVADDLLQDAFLRLLVAARAGGMPDNGPAWLHRVGMNLVIDWSRRRSRAAEAPLAVIGSGDSPESEVLDREQAAALHGAVATLGADSRRALLMNAAGYLPMEIAPVIGRTGAATRTLLCRARRQAREVLVGQLDPGANGRV